MNERLYKLLTWEVFIILLAVVLRFTLADIKPPHFDEGVNGWFADQMTRTGYYHYDPTNYHGPLHFYAVFLSQTLFGRNLWALRLPALIASVLCVWMALRYREFLGAPAARWAAAAMAISPAFVFYGRYSIHESWLVLFSMLFVWGALGLWQKGERKFLFATVGGLVGMILTKETYLIHGGCLLLAAGTLWLWQKVVPSRPSCPWARQQWNKRDLTAVSLAGVFLIVLFYSGMFFDFPSLKGLYETFGTWFRTGADAAGHDKPAYAILGLNFYWLALFARYEWPALLGFIFCFFLASPSDARLRLVAIYAAGILLAYSLIPYKTPWCSISLIWPFLLLFGAAVALVASRWKTAAWIAGILLLLASMACTIRLNFFHYTDEKEPYVYVQTYSDIATLTHPLLTLAEKEPRYYFLRGQILLESYYPIPWMLGDFPGVGYYNKDNMPSALNGDFIVVEESRSQEVEARLTHPYYKRGFRLRDAQESCVVYFRQKPFQQWFGNEQPIVGGLP